MLTREQIDRFHQDGFLVIRDVVRDRELEELRMAANRVVAGGIAGRDEHHRYLVHENGTRTYRRSEKMWTRGGIFQAVTVKPALLEIVGQCIGHPFLPMNDSMVAKIPGGNVPVPWHQDPPFGNPDLVQTHPIPNFVTDIYLDPSTIENGCVWGIPGHHLVGHVDIRSHTEEALFDHPLAVPIEMQPGDVLLHALSAPHGSIGNATQTSRRIFYVHYMALEVFRDCYADVGWMGLPGGPTAEGLAFIRSLRDSRVRMGFQDVISSHIDWTDEGFLVTGEPRTPPRHWGALAQAVPDAERAAKRALRWGRTPESTATAAPPRERARALATA